MNTLTHRLYIYALVGINAVVLIFLIQQGMSYYATPVVERFYHSDHAQLKPSGPVGHGYGIVGSLLILIGVFSYIGRKKIKAIAGWGRLKHWLEFHIFLCTLGPMLVLFHTAFKFGGLVSVSFWSMVAVVASGVVGRFIYLQIPRTIEGRELSLAEANALKINMGELLQKEYRMEDAMVQQITVALRPASKVRTSQLWTAWFTDWLDEKQKKNEVRKLLSESNMPPVHRKNLLRILQKELTLQRRIDRLQWMQKIFRYWHVAHLPFAFIMLIIMVIHVVITLMFGYRWIF